MFDRIVSLRAAFVGFALASSVSYAQSHESCLPSPVIIVPVCGEASISGNAEYVATAYTTGIDRTSGKIVWEDRFLKQWRRSFSWSLDSLEKQAQILESMNRACQALIAGFPRG